ncbi:MAG: L-ribulose-5-phosphate 4-epimerase [Clostridiales bacterium]|jgi:L-ribulose-5-phosphate 4-epimerase|nr:L-ribulose-5-phosphate 4-epimerase [Clostridiales bacterium]
MLKKLKQAVFEANMELPRRKLITYTWGNVSARDPGTGYIVIKPSGVDYDGMKAEDMVVCDAEGKVIEGSYRPSSDTPTHVELYRRYPQIGGIVHTHSPEATAWAQACREIPLYGTTHADYFFGPVPCARGLTDEEINGAYEKNTGLVIIETIEQRGMDPMHVPGILCANHGVFTWGKDAAEAVHNAVVLEELARMAARTEQLRPMAPPAPDSLRDRHFYRKHGANAYYGQGKDTPRQEG